jgi:hypothetical protein
MKPTVIKAAHNGCSLTAIASIRIHTKKMAGRRPRQTVYIS